MDTFEHERLDLLWRRDITKGVYGPLLSSPLFQHQEALQIYFVN